jgi:PAS domain-containing protein
VVWADPATERVLALACQVARADVPVLITGPNGAGQGAHRENHPGQLRGEGRPLRHAQLRRAALGADRGELFGAEAGAYTGATKAREGKFEAADGGTLFLDEIGNLPLAGQVKLLRVLETGRFERLGSNKERQVKVRVVSATNADIAAMIRAGSFREDLYYRLNVIELKLPPLAERPGDILPLAESFLGGEKQLGEAARQLAAAARLARQRARAEEHHPAREAAARERGDRRPTSACPAPPGPPRRAARRRASPTARRSRRRSRAPAAPSRRRRRRAGPEPQALYRRMDRLGIADPDGLSRDRMPAAPLLQPRGPYALLPRCCGRAGGVHRAARRWFPDIAGAGGSSRCCRPAAVAVLVRRQFGPMLSLFRALAGTVGSYRDGDFSFSLRWPRHDEVGELVDAHNELARCCASSACGSVQRELLLDSMVQNTPVAMLLVAEQGPIVYANIAARQLLNSGRKLEGHAIADVLARAAAPLRDAIDRGGDGLFSVGIGGRGGDLPPVAPQFPAQRPQARAAAAATDHRRAAPAGSADLEEGHPRHQPRAQQLAGAGRLARALRRRADRARRAREAARRSSPPSKERARHLEGFIRGYAHFAKLPMPRTEAIAWPQFVARLRSQIPSPSTSRCPSRWRTSTWRRWSRRC